MVLLIPDQVSQRGLWDEWDLRVLVLFGFLTQLYLQFFGSRRSMTLIMKVNTWFLYLLADLWATIALGKLSDVGKNTYYRTSTKRNEVLRGLWVPLVLLNLGGSDTLTILSLEENQMWLRFLIGLIIQGLRTSYVLFLTWNGSWLSILTLLMLLPGIIKYGERVWVIRSRAYGKPIDFIHLDDQLPLPSSKMDQVKALIPDSETVVRAYSCLQTLKPHIPCYVCDRRSLDKLIEDFKGWVGEDDDFYNNTFKMIGIELGLMYDMLFSKVGIVFTPLGCILRLISFSCMVCVFVGVFLIKKLPGYYSEIDVCITYTMLIGTTVLEIIGVVVQLFSYWAMLWAIKHLNTRLLNPIFLFHKFSRPKSKRWLTFVGQIDLLEFCFKFKQRKLDKIIGRLYGKEKMLDWIVFRYIGYNVPVTNNLKVLIIQQLLTRTQNVTVENLQTLTTERGGWTLRSYGCLQEIGWSTEVGFDESIIIWQIATEVCYFSEFDPDHLTDATNEMKTTRTLSRYMLFLLVICPSRFLICDSSDDMFTQACTDVKKIFEERGYPSSGEQACKLLLEQPSDTCNPILESVQRLVHELIVKENRWEIIKNVWVEMLCYAAIECPVKHHAQELRHGGELLTHVWLLLMHFGVTNKPEKIRPSRNFRGTSEFAIRGFTEGIVSTYVS